jgi:hypothetical protein
LPPGATSGSRGPPSGTSPEELPPEELPFEAPPPEELLAPVEPPLEAPPPFEVPEAPPVEVPLEAPPVVEPLLVVESLLEEPPLDDLPPEESRMPLVSAELVPPQPNPMVRQPTAAQVAQAAPQYNERDWAIVLRAGDMARSSVLVLIARSSRGDS